MPKSKSISPQSEAALLKIQNELEYEVSKRTMELNIAYEKLRDENQKRRDMVSMLTHDLRTPLLAARRVLIELQEEEVICQDAKLSALFKAFLQNNTDLMRMVNNMMETYELEDGQFQLLPESVNLHRIVSDCCLELEKLASEKKIFLENRVSEKLPAIQADVLLLKRLLHNLIGNAVANISEGALVLIKAIEEGDAIRVTVQDNGPGIPSELMPYLFNRYLSGFHARKRIGSGLGLYICKMITELHGGTIQIKSLPGQGTTVVFTLPKERNVCP